MPSLGPLAAARLPYTTLIALSFGTAVMRARQRMEARWEHLVASYPDRLDDLEVAFGRHLRDRYPEVRSAHGRTHLVFERADGHRLVMDLAEPLRTPLGWGGLRLSARRGETAAPLPAPDLFLTLLRGIEPEWVAYAGGRLVHRLILADKVFVEDVARRVFG